MQMADGSMLGDADGAYADAEADEPANGSNIKGPKQAAAGPDGAQQPIADQPVAHEQNTGSGFDREALMKKAGSKGPAGRKSASKSAKKGAPELKKGKQVCPRVGALRGHFHTMRDSPRCHSQSCAALCPIMAAMPAAAHANDATSYPQSHGDE